MKVAKQLGGIQQAGARKTAAKSVAPKCFYLRSLIMITKGKIQVLKAEVR